MIGFRDESNVQGAGALEGTDFNYPAYRRGVLGEIFKRFYSIPAALPMTGCPFCERYCGAVRCPP